MENNKVIDMSEKAHEKKEHHDKEEHHKEHHNHNESHKEPHKEHHHSVESHSEPHKEHHHSVDSHRIEHRKKDELFGKKIIILIAGVALVLLFNQWQISSLDINGGDNVVISDISQIKSTGQSIAALFPVGDIQTDQDAINMMISQGTPEYGGAMGVTFDDPVESMNLLAAGYNTVKSDLKENYPDIWQRYLALATSPVGISCEFCCGVGPVGITKSGELKCGCKHNPAIQSLTMLLMKDTSYSDAEILKEAMRWKSLWFPKDMVGLAMKAAGGEIDAELPGMVGGC